MDKLLFSLLITAMLSGCDSKNTEQMEFSNENICRATIATTLHKKLSSIEVDKKVRDITYLYYIRKNDGSRWEYKCKVLKKDILWGMADGRWRDGKYDDPMSFTISNGKLNIAKTYYDNSILENSYSKMDFN
ncbi:MAG: hypothetical protein GY919_17865 [Photobacterium aquimaris]|nr:hypothetical protein [Photobacterium aquimaris]